MLGVFDADYWGELEALIGRVVRDQLHCHHCDQLITAKDGWYWAAGTNNMRKICVRCHLTAKEKRRANS